MIGKLLPPNLIIFTEMAMEVEWEGSVKFSVKFNGLLRVSKDR